MVSTRARTVEIPSMPKREAMAPPDSTPPQACRAAARSLEYEKERNSGVSVAYEKEGKSGASVEYERCREERIRENMERMQKMGIFDLALKLKSSVQRSTPAFKRAQIRRSTPSPAPSPNDLPRRRSSRLQRVAPISYSDRPAKKRERRSPSRRRRISYEAGAREEIYTDEHKDLLGNTESSWTLFVDGYDENGRRIYDPVNGKTCHQCRQKTLGHRTSCSSCCIIQGQFCGDCLYMRYGENVLEAMKNPEWVCPVCRDICNCSLCRIKKGWAPTGPLYKKIASLGFKSVAHYLVQTRREEQPDAGRVASAPPVSAQRSLAFPEESGDGDRSGKKQKKAEDSAAEKIEGGKGSGGKLNEDGDGNRGGKGRTLPEVATPLSPDSIAWRLRSRVKASA